MFSIVRTAVDDGIIISLCGDNANDATSVRHKAYTSDGDIDINYSLSFVEHINDTYKYKYKIDEGLRISDSFQVFSGSTVVASFIGLEDSVDSLVPYSLRGFGSGVSGPSSELENREPEIYNYHYFYPGNFDIRGLTTNIFPYYNGAFFEVSALESRSFESALTPQSSNRDYVSNLLEDPETLFNGDSGSVFIIPEEEVVIIPFSDGETAWSEEYTFDDFYGAYSYPLNLDRRDYTNKKAYVYGLPYWKVGAYSIDRSRGVIYNEELRDKWIPTPPMFKTYPPVGYFNAYYHSFSKVVPTPIDVLGVESAPITSDFQQSVNLHVAWAMEDYGYFGEDQ